MCTSAHARRTLTTPRPVMLAKAGPFAVEALSNVALHARAHRCDLRILIAPGEELQIEVSDDGTGLNGSPPGVGLTGMRERAAELGGRCTVSANPSGGVRVLAALPLRSAP